MVKMAITGGWVVILAVSLSLASTQRTGVISHHLVNSVLTPRLTPKSSSVLRTQQDDLDKALTSSFLSAKFPTASGSFPRRSGTVRIRLNNPTWRSTTAIRARRKYPIPWSTWRRTARDSRDVVVRRHQLLPLPTSTSLLPRRTTSSLSTSPNSVTSRIMSFRLPSLREMVSHVLRAATRGSAAVTRGSSAVTRGSSAFTRGSSAFTRGSSAVARDSSAVTRGSSAFTRGSSAFTRGSSAVARDSSAVTGGSSALARGPQAIARTSSTVGRGSSAITRGFPAASEGSGPAASSASGSEVGTEALPAALPLGGFASAAGSASPVKSLFGVPSDDPYYAILTTLTEPFPALPPSVRALLRRRALAVAAARASVAAAGQSRTGASLMRTAAGASSLGQTAAGAPRLGQAAGASSLGQTAAGAPRLGQAAAAAAASSVGQTAAGTSSSVQAASGALRLGQAATAASSLTQTASAAQSLTRTASGAQSVGQTASGTSPRQIPGSIAVVEGPEIQAESSSDVLRILPNVHSQAQNLASPVFGVLEAVERVINLLDRQAQKQAQPACTGSQARAGSRLNEQGEEDDENCQTEQVGTSRDSPASQASSSANDTASSTDDSASSTSSTASSADNTASSTDDSASSTGSTASPTGSTASPTGSTASSANDTASSTDDSASSDDDTASASSDPTSTSITTLLFSRGIPVLTASAEGVKVTLLNRSNKLVCDLAAGYSLDLTTNKVIYSGLDPTTSRSTAPRGGGPTFYTVSVDPHLGLLSLEPVAVNALDLMRAMSAQKTSTSDVDPGFLGSVLGSAQKTSTSELDPGFLSNVLGAGAEDSAGRKVEASTTPLMKTTTVVDSQVESEERSVSEDLETEETISPSASAGVQSGTQALSSSQDVDDSGAQTLSTTRSSLEFPADSRTQSETQTGSSGQDADYESQEQSGVQTISTPQTASKTPSEMPAESSSQELDSQTRAMSPGILTTSTPQTDSESSHAPSAAARDSSTASTPSLDTIPANSETETEERPEAEEPETEDTTPDSTSAWTESTLDSGSPSRTTDSQVQMQSGVTETSPRISSTPFFPGEETSLLTQGSSATTANTATSTSIPPLETIPLDYDAELEETAEAEEYEMWETTPASTSIGTTTSSSSLANNPLWVALTSNNSNLFNVTSEDLAEMLKILLKGSIFTGTSSMAPAEAGVVNDVTVGSASADSASAGSASV